MENNEDEPARDLIRTTVTATRRSDLRLRRLMLSVHRSQAVLTLEMEKHEAEYKDLATNISNFAGPQPSEAHHPDFDPVENKQMFAITSVLNHMNCVEMSPFLLQFIFFPHYSLVI
jgi:hypothetical protein